MNEYHKIQTVFKRDPDTKYKALIDGVFATDEFEYLARNKWVFTEKVDGTNIRVMMNDGIVTFGGKTDRAQIPATLVNRLNELFIDRLPILMDVFTDSPEVCLYGEGFGPKIQKGGGNYGETQEFVLFDVKIGPWWLRRIDVEDVAEKLGIQVAPIIGYGDLLEMVRLVRGGLNSRWGGFRSEGIVARPYVELFDRKGNRIITKVKHKDFLA